jgi:putative tricarboxylic transport membrane protein
MFGDRVICAAALLLAAVYLYAAAQIPSLQIGDPLGPKAFPRLLGAGLIVSAVLLFIETVRGDRRETAAPAAGAKRQTFWIIAAVVGWTTLYLVLFDKAGYVVASAAYLLGLMAYFNRGKWLANVLTSLLFCVLSYLLFTKALGVALPKGVLPF